MADMDVSQLQRLHEKMRLLAAEVTGGKLSDTYAHILLQLCQEEVPVDTGRLQASHSIQESSSHRVRITASAYYAQWVHDGHFNRLTGQFIPPNPWMTRALSQLQSTATQQVLAALAKDFRVPEPDAFRVTTYREGRLSRLFGRLRARFG